MERREAVRNMALLMGAAISASTMGALLDSCNHPAGAKAGNVAFSPGEQLLVTDIANIIIPDTDTPGAKAAGVGPFITMMVKECYNDKAQKVFVNGLKDVDDRSEKLFSKNFLKLSVDQKTHILKNIADETTEELKKDKQQRNIEKDENMQATSKGAKNNAKPYFFQIMRDLSLLGYFTSEIGATKSLVYLPVPGRFDGCVDLTPGQKAYAS